MTKYSVIVPVYKDIDIAKNAILSLARQYRTKRKEQDKFADWTIELVIVNDSPDVDMKPLKKLFDDNKACKDWTSKYIVMESNQGEGNARKVGIKECSGQYFFLMDCDDVFGPNLVSKVNEILVEQKKLGYKVSMVEYPFTSFDIGYTKIIEPYSIWVQGRVYNKEFVTEHGIWSTDLSSRAGADYNFMSKLHGVMDYYDRDFNERKKQNADAKPEWVRIIANAENGYSWSYWFPSNSQTRACDYWGEWICPITTLNGLDYVKFMRKFEEDRDEKDSRREFWKHDILNRACYQFINLHDMLRSLTCKDTFKKRVTEKDPVSGEDNNTVFYDLFKKAFIGVADMCREYIDEIWDMDIWTCFEGVWNRSDVHKCMPWFDFRKFIYDPYSLGIFNFNNMKELIAHCEKAYAFDQNGFPLHADQYKKFMERMKKDA